MHIGRSMAAVGAAWLLCAASARGAIGQFNIGDVLVSDFGANNVRQFSPLGTLIQTYPSSGSETLGVVVTPQGKLFAANRNSSSTQHIGTVDVFLPDGTRTSTFNIPQVGYAFDMAMFPDGVLAITDIGGPVQLYTQAGAFVRTISVPGDFHTGDTVAASDGSLWVTAETSQVMYNFNENGALLRSFTTPFEPRDLQVARDGTLWIGALFDSRIYHYTASGSQLGTISTGLSYASPLALSADELSIFATYEGASNIDHYSITGQFLGNFPVPGAMDLACMTVVTVPEPAVMGMLLGAVVLLRRRRR